MDLAYCEHGLAARRKEASANAGSLLISRKGLAHFPGCPHKDDDDFNGWIRCTAADAGELGADVRYQGNDICAFSS